MQKSSFLILFVLIFSIFSIPLNSSFGQLSGLDLYLAITPSNIERTAASHNIGYVSLINKQGISVSSQQSIDVYLSSSNKEIATVPEKVTIESGSKFKQFPVVTSGKRGDVIITATFGKLSSSSKLAVGIIRDGLLPGTSLEIRIPSKEMLINTEMPFSIYLKTPDGKIQRALKDITLDLSYDDNLITTESHTITIKEGDNYAWGILSSKGVSGKGYLQAKNAELDLDSATHVNVSSNFGTKIDVDVFPKVVTSGNDRQIDIFVSIIDDAGNPTVASEDVYLTLFSNRDFIGTQLEKITKDEKPMIKKGQFGYHLSHKFDLLKTLDNFIEIGANAKNYGVKYDYFSIAGTTYTTDSDKFTDAQVKISSLYGDVKFDEDTGFGYDFEVVLFGPKSIPPGVESIVGIETAVLEVDVDDKDLVDCTVDVINATGAVVDQTQTQCPNPNFYEVETDPKVCGFSTKSVTVNKKNQLITDPLQRKFNVPVDCSKPILSVDNLPTGYYYPIQSNFVYEKIGNVNDKVVVTSSNTKIIPEISSIRLEQSQGSGYAVIKSGQNTGQSDISVSIEGIGSKSLPITVIDTKSHNTTKIFSPLGNDEIFLNGNGDADVFVIPFDFAGRPKKMFEDTDYLLKPANSVFHLGKNKSFLKTEFPIDQKTIGNTNQFDLAQVGTKLTQTTDASQNFFINSTSHILMTLPNPNLTSQQMGDLAMVQLADSDGNPIVVNKDTTIMISSSDERIVSIPNSAIIPAGFSYGFFTINTLDVQGTTTLTATGKGLDSKSLVVNTMQSESRLGISIDSSPEFLTPKTPSKIQFSVFDSNQKSVEGANVEIYSSDQVQIQPRNILTNKNGEGTAEITTKSDKSITITLMATKEGYLDSSKQITLDVAKTPGISVSDFQFESWMLYLIIAAVVIVGIFVFLFFRKTKEVVNWEEDI